MFEELMEAIEEKNNERAIDLITQIGQEELNQTTSDGETLLYIATLKCYPNYEIVKLLLEKMSFDAINAQEKYKKTALHYAAEMVMRRQ